MSKFTFFFIRYQKTDRDSSLLATRAERIENVLGDEFTNSSRSWDTSRRTPFFTIRRDYIHVVMRARDTFATSIIECRAREYVLYALLS